MAIQCTMTMIRFFALIFILLALAETAKAQVVEDNKRIQMPDTLHRHLDDYEEWLRNEPLKPEPVDSSILKPLPPELHRISPDKILAAKHPPLQIDVITPRVRQDMRLAYQSHWLEEQRKQQLGGAMTIGVNPLSLAALIISKIFPHRKSKKERQREKMQQILDNY